MRGAGNKAGPLARVTLGLLAAVLVGCATLSGAPDASDSSAREGYLPVDQLQIVDCLLPGQIRKLGSMVYKTQRRPIRTTAADCEVRGGEYVAYDRADYRSALHVWLARAKAGKAKAQNYVGEIFEKGLGRTPDYVSAAAWYRRAAEQGDARAQINLGFLYEKGLGVEKDVTKALYWYRKASGLTPDDDQIVWKSSNDQERRKLENQLATARQQVAVLQGQIDQMQAARGKLQNKLEQARKAGSGSSGRAEALQAQLTQAQTQIATLAQLAQRAREERRNLDDKLETMPAAGSQPASSAKAPTVAANNQKRDTQVRSISEADSESQNRAPQPAVATQAKPLSARGVKFGKYYALIIGNQDYKYLDDLKTPLGDAHKLQQVLEKKYGFR
ncbi:MAG: hypothetical protein L0H19_03250, partial [Salinisphaera sp.]|nr:hypothetical protein [Salinisphaera sp.]